MRRLGTLVFVLALCAALSACGSSASRPSSPKAVIASILSAALAQKSVQYTETVTRGSYGTYRSTYNVSADSGTKHLNFYYGETMDARLVGHTIYVRAARLLLEMYLNLSEGQADKYAWQWISIPRDDKRYAHLAYGLTLASVGHAVIPHGRLKVLTKHWREQQLLDVRGTHGPQRDDYYELTATPTGKPLPVTYSYRWGTYVINGSFSRWNESVSVHAPLYSTPIATVRGG